MLYFLQIKNPIICFFKSRFYSDSREFVQVMSKYLLHKNKSDYNSNSFLTSSRHLFTFWEMIIYFFQSLIEKKDKKISKGIEDLNPNKKPFLIDPCRTPEPRIAEFALFSSTHLGIYKKTIWRAMK